MSAMQVRSICSLHYAAARSPDGTYFAVRIVAIGLDLRVGDHNGLEMKTAVAQVYQGPAVGR